MRLIVPHACLYMSVLGLCLISCDTPQKQEQRQVYIQDTDRSLGSGPNVDSVIVVQSEVIPHESLLLATGAQLYKIHCELCHGSLADLGNNAGDTMTASLLGKNSLAIKVAMESIPEMRPLLDQDLSDSTLDLIATELNRLPAASHQIESEPMAVSAVGENYQPVMLSGLQMYKKHCGDASCHGAAEASSIDSKDFGAFIGALNSVAAMKDRTDLQGLSRSHLEEIFKSL